MIIDRETISLPGMAMNSDAWVAWGRLLFGERQGHVGRPFRFCCDSCGHRFDSIVTPERCPRCDAEPGPLGVTLTHALRSNPRVKVTAKTFPFSTRG